MTAPESPPELSPLGLCTVLIGAALPLLDYYIVNVALPSIGGDLHAGPASLELIVSGYGLAHAVLLVQSAMSAGLVALSLRLPKVLS